MRTPQSQFTSLIVIVAALALVGGIVIVLVTSRDSLELAPELWFGSQTAAAPTNTPPPSGTPTPTAPEATATPTQEAVAPRATHTPEPTLEAPTLTPTPENTLPEGVVAIAQVSFSGVAARLRDAPNGRVIGALLKGTQVEILEGRQEADGIIWVEIRAETGETGWMSEDLLEIVEAPQLPPESTPAEANVTPLPTLPGGAQGTATVQLDSGTAARLRDAPGGRVIGGLLDGAQVQVLQGRVLQDGIVWVEIKDETGLVGWISEELLIYNTPGG